MIEFAMNQKRTGNSHKVEKLAHRMSEIYIGESACFLRFTHARISTIFTTSVGLRKIRYQTINQRCNCTCIRLPSFEKFISFRAWMTRHGKQLAAARPAESVEIFAFDLDLDESDAKKSGS